MTRKRKAGVITLLLALLAVPTARAADGLERIAVPAGSVVAELHALRKGVHGIDGSLALITDERITAANRRGLQDWYMFGFAEPVAVNPPVTRQALADAELRLVEPSGRIVTAMPLSTPFAQLRAIPLFGDRPTEFLLETAMGGFGQFTGTAGRLLTVQRGAIKAIAARDKATGAEEDVILSRAPKTDWRVIPARSTGSDIFQVRCLPAQGSVDSFGEEYVSYRPCPEGLCRTRRVGRGYCAWPDGFPMLAEFP